MLNRRLKRKTNNNEEDKIIVRVKQDDEILGLKGRKRKSVASLLEKEVLGGDADIVESLFKSSEKEKPHKRQSKWAGVRNDRVAVWEDGGEDETEQKQKFEKISRKPAWAELDRDNKVDNSSDESDEELTRSTGDYLTQSISLPKSILNIKKCPDANREQLSHGKIRATEFHPSAQVVLTAGMDQSLHLFQVDGKHNRKIQSVFLDNYPIHTAHFSTDGHEVILGSKHKSFFYYDMIAGKVVNVPKLRGLEEHNMKRFEVSPDGQYLAFLGRYGHIHLISSKSKEWIATLKINGSVESVAFSPDGSTMYAFGDDGEVYMFDLATRDCVHRFRDEGCIKGTALAVSNDNKYVACGSYSGVVNIYNAASCATSSDPKPLKAVMNLTTPCTQLVFNPAAEILAMASNYTEKAVKLLHFPSLTVFSNYPDRNDDLRIPMCMDFSRNGGYLAVGAHKGHANLYRVKHYGNF